MSDLQPDLITRRGLLRGAAAMSALAIAGAAGELFAKPAAARPRLIAEENARPGCNDWQLTRVRVDRADGCRQPAIEGYCSKQSVAAGEKLEIMVSTMPEHWIFQGTGMKRGDRVPGLIGWEFHGDPPADVVGLEIVGEGTAWQGGVTPSHWTATIYPGPKGNYVFNAATIFWAQGLSKPPGHILPWSHWNRPHGPDPRVQQITHNLLRRACGEH